MHFIIILINLHVSQKFLASSSESECESGEEAHPSVFSSVFSSAVDEPEQRSRKDTIAMYRDFVAGMDKIDHAKENEEKLLQRSTGQCFGGS